MSEPLIFGVPLTQMFLYFVLYSFLGWCMESTYCSIKEHHLINRGFLHLPICPIYGAGVIIMVNFFTPFLFNPFLFYLMATLVMSAWEYFVGWLLETTTHMKYWDYSDRRFNLKGRICLGNCIWWGIISYVIIYWVHPVFVHLFSLLPDLPRLILACVLTAVILADTVFTIRDLALISKAMRKAEEARVQLELAKKELQEQLDAKKAALAQGLESRQEALSARKDRTLEKLAELEERSRLLLSAADRHTSRFVRHYATMTTRRYPKTLTELKKHLDELRNKHGK